jgi:hypothetical protein
MNVSRRKLMTLAAAIRHLLACKPAGQRDTHCILAEFVRPFRSHSSFPLLQ